MADHSESLFWDNYYSKTKAYRIKPYAVFEQDSAH